jgi:hypothetical protein
MRKVSSGASSPWGPCRPWLRLLAAALGWVHAGWAFCSQSSGKLVRWCPNTRRWLRRSSASRFTATGRSTKRRSTDGESSRTRTAPASAWSAGTAATTLDAFTRSRRRPRSSRPAPWSWTARSRFTTSIFAHASTGCASPTPTRSPRRRCSWSPTYCTATAAS